MNVAADHIVEARTTNCSFIKGGGQMNLVGVIIFENCNKFNLYIRFSHLYCNHLLFRLYKMWY